MDKIEKEFLEEKKADKIKKSRGHKKTMIVKKKCSYKYNNQYNDFRNYETILATNILKMNSGFNISKNYCMDIGKIKPITKNKLSYIKKLGLKIIGNDILKI